MTELISKDIVDLQDIEKVQFLQTLQADPAKYAAFVSDKSQRILGEVTDTKRAAFVRAAGTMAQQMDMDHNSMATEAQAQGMVAMQDHLIVEQTGQRNAIKSNKDNTRRQVEINNWYYENKRETLFVLQLVLLVMLTVTVILTLTHMGFIPQAGADYLMLFVIIVGLGTWLYRWYYTRYIRDPRFWSRRVFSQDGKVEAPSGEICIGGDSGGLIGADGTRQPVPVPPGIGALTQPMQTEGFCNPSRVGWMPCTPENNCCGNGQ
jgi:hypothetical protein